MTDESRRRFVRWEVDRRIKVKFEDLDEHVDCHIRDLSLKGLQITTKLDLGQDKPLKLLLVLNDEFILNVETWVAWHKVIGGQDVYGLYFIKIKDLDKEKIYQFVRRYLPQELHSKWWGGPEEKGDDKMEDRRVFARFPVKLGLKFLDLDHNQEGIGQTLDLSAKGIGFVTSKELKANAPLEIWLKIPDTGDPLYLRGEVAWSESTGADQCRSGICLEKADLMAAIRLLRGH